MKTILTLFTLFFAFSHICYADPAKFELNKLFDVGTILLDIETGANVYVATSDDQKYLRNIIVTTNGVSKSLYELSDLNDDGSSKSLTVSGGLTYKTTNNDTITSRLTGFLYATTYEQAKDAKFKVYTIVDRLNLNRPEPKSTTVILHVEYDEMRIFVPKKTSLVTDIRQSSNTNVYMRVGYPSRNYTYDDNLTFFRNPINLLNYNETTDTTTRISHFFDNVEPLQINTDIWYFIADGPVVMTISKKYQNMSDYTTTAINSTGVVINEGFFEGANVHLILNPANSRVSGFFLSTYVNYETSFAIQTAEGQAVMMTVGINGSNSIGASGWSPMAATLYNVTSTHLEPGRFYSQYFGYEGAPLPITTTVSTDNPTTQTTTTPTIPTTSQTIQSTTKSHPDPLILSIYAFMLCLVIVQ